MISLRTVVGLRLHEWLMTVMECDQWWDVVCLFKSKFIHQWPGSGTCNWPLLLLLTAVQGKDSIFRRNCKVLPMKDFREVIDFMVLKCSLLLYPRLENLPSCSLCLRKYTCKSLFYFLLFFLPTDPIPSSRMLGKFAGLRRQEGNK